MIRQAYIDPNLTFTLVAAGGGGGGAHSAGAGGAGGGTAGAAGGGGLDNSGGAGGTSSTAGSAGAGDGLWNGSPSGNGGGSAAGSSVDGSTNFGGGGGGGGYLPGGGGGGGVAKGGGGGGGGACGPTITGAAFLSHTFAAGSGQMPGNVSDADYPGGNVGWGSTDGQGGCGAVVVLALYVPSVPVITSTLTRSAVVGQTVSYQIVANSSPTSYGATPLPAGLSVNSTTGAITGTLTTAATTNTTLSATNAQGTGQATLVWTVSADTTAPSVPAGFAATALSSTALRLTWTESTDNAVVVLYEVRKDGTLYGSPTTAAIDVTGLTAGTTYAFTARSKDSSGNWSAWSSAFNFQQPTLSGPGAPTGLNYADRTDTSITLIWNAPTGALPIVGYKIFRGGSEIGYATDVVFTDTGLPSNTSQTYTVKAVDSSGTVSSASNSLSVSTTLDSTTDSDHDGVPNAMETVLGTNPNSAGVNDGSNQTQLKINHPSK